MAYWVITGYRDSASELSGFTSQAKFTNNEGEIEIPHEALHECGMKISSLLLVKSCR